MEQNSNNNNKHFNESLLSEEELRRLREIDGQGASVGDEAESADNPAEEALSH